MAKTDPTGLPVALASFIRDTLDIKVFVETGTGLGRTTNIVKDMFDRVYTIEAHQERWTQAKNRFENDNGMVICIFGKSPNALVGVLDSINHEQAIVFLDAHCSYRQIVDDNICPLLDEIGVVTSSNPDHIIFIDDQHSFASFPPNRHCWDVYPELVAVISKLQTDRNPYIFIEGKCIVSIPRCIKASVGEFLSRSVTSGYERT